MTDREKERLYDEAADLFMRLQDASKDPQAWRDRDAFLARGPDARRAYRSVEKAWAVSGKKKGPGTVAAIAIAALLCAGFYFAIPQARDYLVADVRSGLQPVTSELSSGDRVVLDANSAFVDKTETGTRHVELLKGAGYFDVTPGERPFVVSVGPLEVRAIGTAFETAHLFSTTSVAVFEGIVEVRTVDAIWRLEAGDTLRYAGRADAVQGKTEAASVASWRSGELIVNGMQLADVVEIIDRRLPGKVVVASGALAKTRVTAVFDLTNPAEALDLLAESFDARVIAAPPLGRLMIAR